MSAQVLADMMAISMKQAEAALAEKGGDMAAAADAWLTGWRPKRVLETAANETPSKRQRKNNADSEKKRQAAAAEKKRQEEAAAEKRREEEAAAEKRRKEEEAAAEQKRKEEAAAAEKKRQEEEAAKQKKDGEKQAQEKRRMESLVFTEKAEAARGTLSLQTAKRLGKELWKMSNNVEEAENAGYEIFPIDSSDYSKPWRLVLKGFAETDPFTKSCKRLGIPPTIDCELSFTGNYPFDPPACRVTYPEISHMNVFTAGAICFQALVGNGWSPAMPLANLAIALRNHLVGNTTAKAAHNKQARTVPAYTEQKAASERRVIEQAHPEWTGRGGRGR